MSSEDARTRLLLAAGPVFARKGYLAATVREICRSANVNVASINYYFGDKETLYIETVKCARQHRAWQHPLPDWLPGTPAETRLRDFITTMARRIVVVEASSWHVRLLLREVVEPTGICREMVEEYIDPLFHTLVGILRELLPETAPTHVLRKTAFSVVGQCLYYRVADEVIGRLVDPAERGRHFQPDQVAEHITEMTLAALGAGPTLQDKFAVSQIAEQY